MKNYPDWICDDCGNKYGKFPDGHTASYHTRPCDVCDTITMVTEPRDYGYPNIPGFKRKFDQNEKAYLADQKWKRKLGERIINCKELNLTDREKQHIISCLTLPF